MTTPRPRPPLLALIVALSGAPGCSQGAHASPAPDAEPVAISLDTALVREQTLPRTIPLTGSLRALRRAELSAEISGIVTQTFVERGDRVVAGQVIARLDARGSRFTADEARALAASAQAERALAQRECERADRLLEAGAIDHAEHERRLGRCTVHDQTSAAAVARSMAAANLVADSIVRAPFSGVIDERVVSRGELVAPGRPIARLVDASRLTLELAVPEHHVAEVALGQPVSFAVAAHGARRFEAKVTRVAAALRPSTRDLLVEAEIDNVHGLLSPGMFAVANLSVGERRALVAPAAALGGGAESARAFVVIGQHVEERVVARGEQRGELVEVRAGLAAGERVVTELSERVQDGLRVQ